MGNYYTVPKRLKDTSIKGSVTNLNEVLIPEIDIHLIRQIAQSLKVSFSSLY
jgi:hypothetical protein